MPWISCRGKSQRQNSCHWTSSSKYYPTNIHLLSINIISSNISMISIEVIIVAISEYDHHHYNIGSHARTDWQRFRVRYPPLTCKMQHLYRICVCCLYCIVFVFVLYLNSYLYCICIDKRFVSQIRPCHVRCDICIFHLLGYVCVSFFPISSPCHIFRVTCPGSTVCARLKDPQ